MTPTQRAEFDSSGAARFAAALSATETDRVAAMFGVGDRPGKRLSAEDLTGIADLLSGDGAIGAIAQDLIGPKSRPVRAILLDKSPEANWRLGWHQDRTIAVEQRIDVDGFGPWSLKAGQPHVQPPHDVTAAMITLRIHVDDVDPDSAPLEILPGSHLAGRLSNQAVDRLAESLERQVCLGDSGDVWAYSTAIVHRSAEQCRPSRRRVLQVDFSASELPGGLEWAALI